MLDAAREKSSPSKYLGITVFDSYNTTLFSVYWTITLWSVTVQLLLPSGQLRYPALVYIHLIYEELKSTRFIPKIGIAVCEIFLLPKTLIG